MSSPVLERSPTANREPSRASQPFAQIKDSALRALCGAGDRHDLVLPICSPHRGLYTGKACLADDWSHSPATMARMGSARDRWEATADFTRRGLRRRRTSAESSAHVTHPNSLTGLFVPSLCCVVRGLPERVKPMRRVGPLRSLQAFLRLPSTLHPLLAQVTDPPPDLRGKPRPQNVLSTCFYESRKSLQKGELELELSTFYSTDRETHSSAPNSWQRSRQDRQPFGRHGTYSTLRAPQRPRARRPDLPSLYAEQEVHLGATIVRTHDEGIGDIAAGLKIKVWDEAPAATRRNPFPRLQAPTGNGPLLGTGLLGMWVPG